MKSTHPIVRARLAAATFRHTRGDRRFAVIAVIASCLLHLAVIGIKPGQETKITFVNSSGTTAVKIRLYTPAAFQNAPVNQKATSDHRNRLSSGLALNSHPAHSAAKEPSNTSEARGQSIRRYSDLLPTNSYAMEQDVRAVPSAVPGTIEAADEFESKPFAEKVRFVGNLIRVANEVKEAISVPSAIRKSVNAGHARVFLRRTAGPPQATWQVVAADGDPYFRAILYSTMLLAEDQSRMGRLLADVSYDSISVTIEWRSSPLSIPQPPPRIDGNKITIIINELVPLPSLLTIPLGVNNGRDKMEMRRLEASPAFLHAFRRAGGR